MQLPHKLAEAIEEELADIEPALLAKATAELSARYRNPETITNSLITSKAHRTAYLATRMPATYAAIQSVMREIRRRLPETPFHSLLDLGSGPGTVMWAAAETFQELEQITLIERDHDLIEIGKRLAKYSDHPALTLARWTEADLRRDVDYQPHDIVFISYALGELDEKTARQVIRRAWQAAKKIVAVIEPGTPRGYSKVLAVRTELIELGTNVVAPCPHALTCPMATSNDWCHFAQRLERSSLHRRAKFGSMSYEDEKYSYFVGAKLAVDIPDARIVRHPHKQKGHVNLELCTAGGLKQITVSKKHKEAYKRARKADWGAEWNFEGD